MNPAGSLEGFQQNVYYRYHNIQQTIVGILLAYPTDNVALPILNHMDYFHVQSDDLFDFYFPGYLKTDTWCPKYNTRAFSIIGCDVNFCPEWYVEFINYFNEIIPHYRYSGNPELLLFNVSKGRIDYNHKVLVNLKELQSNENRDFNTLFETIYECVNDAKTKSTSELKKELGIEILSDSILDTLKAIIARKFPLFRHYENNRRGIYFN